MKGYLATFTILARLLPLLLLTRGPPPADGADFNDEVQKRVNERLGQYMGDPAASARLIANYRDFGGFPHGLSALDREEYLRFGWTIVTAYNQKVYYGLEDGHFLGFPSDTLDGWYREPGDSGYIVDDIPADMVKYYGSCINPNTGAQENCTMPVGEYYISCVDGCSLGKCPDDDSQRDCKAVPDEEERVQCESKVKWCKNYTKEKAPEGMKLGYIPSSIHCRDQKGQFTQTEGQVWTGSGTLGNCHYSDGMTLVDRSISGDYEYCGGEGQVCNDTFTGAHTTLNYDPRWRGWYEETKRQQKSIWSDPYPFFDELRIGITYSKPVYSKENGKNVFVGVLAVDYTFDDIAQFLVDAYSNTPMSVIIFEDSEPHYLVASSIGSKGARRVLSSDGSTPCPDTADAESECIIVRVTASELLLEGSAKSTVLARAFEIQKESGFPQAEILAVKATDDAKSDAYASKSQIYEQEGTNLKWRVTVVMPMDKAAGDSITKGTALFGVLIMIGALGFIFCAALFGMFYNKRKERAVIHSDWRFTSAFILGSAFLNWSTFTLLGPNTDATCMLRMWSFHFLFVLALSPLLVKVWRMNSLVGERAIRNVRRTSISHKRAAMYTLPMILFQAIILTIFSIVDPPRQSEFIDISGGSTTQHLVCTQGTQAFMIIELIYEPGLVFAGCILAYMTRNLDEKFGESKQLIFAMYNIAFIGLVIILVVQLMDVDQAGKYSLQAIGVFWGTVFSSFAFVLPRLMQVRDSDKSVVSGVSGLNSTSNQFGKNNTCVTSVVTVDQGDTMPSRRMSGLSDEGHFDERRKSCESTGSKKSVAFNEEHVIKDHSQTSDHV